MCYDYIFLIKNKIMQILFISIYLILCEKKFCVHRIFFNLKMVSGKKIHTYYIVSPENVCV